MAGETQFQREIRERILVVIGQDEVCGCDVAALADGQVSELIFDPETQICQHQKPSCGYGWNYGPAEGD